MSDLKHPNLRNETDRLLVAAFETNGTTATERIGQIDAIATGVGTIAERGFQTNTEHGVSSFIYGSAMLACLPSIKQIARGQGHNAEVSGEVAANLQDLAGNLAERRILKRNGAEVVGTLSEVAVLSTIWWASSRGFASPDSYALLASTKQDESSAFGRRDGLDISARINGGKKLIQVKAGRRDAAKVNGYADGISVVTPGDLLPAHNVRESNRKLFNALAQDGKDTLITSWHRLAGLLRINRTERRTA